MSLKTNRIIELALVIFIALFSFSIGTYVGKKYSDNQHRLASLEPNKKNSSEHAEEASHDEANTHGEGHNTETTAHNTEEGSKVSHGDSEMTDAEVAKLADEFSQDVEMKAKPEAKTDEHSESTESHGTESHASSSHGSTKHGETANSHAPSKEHTPTSKEITTTQHETTSKKSSKDIKEVTEDGEETHRDVASVPVKDKMISAKFTVQVGAYPSEEEAQKVADSLLARGYKAMNIPATVKGRQFYRVQVGAFKTMEEAQDYKKELMEKNRLTSAFVQKLGL